MQVAAVREMAGQDSAHTRQSELPVALHAPAAAAPQAGQLLATSLFAAIVVSVGFAAFLHLLCGEALARVFGRYGGWAIIALSIVPGIAVFIAVAALKTGYIIAATAIELAIPRAGSEKTP